jgi:SAM-dependent methyltransferase
MGHYKRRRAVAATAWDSVADWYAGWVGEEGSEHHRRLAIPAVLDLLNPRPGEQILDLGAGAGVLAPAIADAGAHYTGVDASPRLLAYARQRHGCCGRFVLGDVARLSALPALGAGSFDGVVFLLSVQDMNPLHDVFASAAWALRRGGRLVLLITHPCFRVPRQSGWGWDEGRKLRYRRVDRYLTPLAVPMKTYRGGRAATRSYHRPLEAYVNGLAACGMHIDRLCEIPTYQVAPDGVRARAENLAHREIPLFLGLRACTATDAQ